MNPMSIQPHTKKRHSWMALVFSALILSGCGLELPFIIAATGVGVGVNMAIDRRSTQSQLDDEAIEQKIVKAINDNYAQSHVNVTSFNQAVLLTGEVADDHQKATVERLAKQTEKVRGVFNYVIVGPVSGLGARSQDSLITSRVKTAMVSDHSMNARDVKVVTEGTVVYLLGILSESESQRARDLAASVSGVSKVMTFFEIISEEEAKKLRGNGDKIKSPVIPSSPDQAPKIR